MIKLSEQNLESEKICCKLKIEAKYGELICLENFERRLFLVKEMIKIVEETCKGY